MKINLFKCFLILLTITIFSGQIVGKQKSFSKPIVIDADNSDFDNANAIIFKNETLDNNYFLKSFTFM